MSNIITWISDEIKHFLGWLKGAEAQLAHPISIAETVLNGIKNFDASIPGQTLETLLESLIPASTGLLNAFKLQLPIWLKDLGYISDEAGKTLDEQWNDAIKAIRAGGDDTVATQLSSLKALFTKFFGDNTGVPVSIQDAITLSNPTHNAQA